MRHRLIIFLLLISGAAFANPYDGQVSMFDNGKEVTKTYHQMLREKSLEGLSPLSKQVHELALEVFDNPNSADAKKRYFESFPRSFRSFMDIFQPNSFGELYDGYIYIHLIDSLASEYPETVGSIYLKLASKACLDADAPNYLRHNLVAFEGRYPEVYKKYYNNLTSDQQHNVELFEKASMHNRGKGICNF